jgi:hypothetical protein
MEVHHPHHPSHKKKWAEYIIEFVMLFAAVTLGFLAENIREHQVEKHKTEKSLISLYNETQNDSIAFAALIPKRTKTDTLFNIISKYHNNGTFKNHLSEVYLFIHYISYRRFAIINHMVIDEIKSTGRLNFVDDNNLLNNIQKYSLSSRLLEIRENREENFLSQFIDPIRIEFFNYNTTRSISYGKEIIIENGSFKPQSVDSLYKKIELVNKDHFNEETFLNTMNGMSAVIVGSNSMSVIPAQKQCIDLLKSLRNYFYNNNIDFTIK